MDGAARLAESYRPDLIDINCGCWVRDVAMRGAGAGLLRDLPRMEKIVTSVVKAVGLPVTLKTRLGWDAASIRIVDVAKMCEQVGIRGLTVHCRTRDQGHKGSVDYSWIPRIKGAVSIPVIVNGDIVTPQDVASVFRSTGCDGVMIGRAAVGNPWIFARQDREQGAPAEKIALLRRHLARHLEFYGARAGLILFRKHAYRYVQSAHGAAALRHAFEGPASSCELR